MIAIRPIILILFCAFIISCSETVKNENIKNAKRFFEKLAADGGTWIQHPQDTTTGFYGFIMKFQLHNNDTLTGEISGLTKTGDTVHFWSVKEYGDPMKDSIVFEQNGKMGHVKSMSYFPDPMKRRADFELAYLNGTFERHKDTHTLLNDSTMLTESEIHDQLNKIWVEQPKTIWRRIK